MKKLISVILTLTFVLTLLPTVMSVSADTGELTQSEAETLVIEAFNKISLLYYTNVDEVMGKYLKTDKIVLDSKNKGFDTYFEKSSAGETYPKPADDVFSWVSDERFSTMDKCYAFVTPIFTEKLSNELIKKNYMGYEFFRTAEGEEYYSHGGAEKHTFTKDEMLYCALVLSTDGGSGRFGLKSIGTLKTNGNQASLDVEYKHKYLEYTPGITLKEEDYTMTVEFERTESGWRVSGGTFIDFIMHKIDVDDLKNPSTGDNTAPLVLAAFASLLPLAWFGLRRKRSF